MHHGFDKLKQATCPTATFLKLELILYPGTGASHSFKMRQRWEASNRKCWRFLWFPPGRTVKAFTSSYRPPNVQLWTVWRHSSGLVCLGTEWGALNRQIQMHTTQRKKTLFGVLVGLLIHSPAQIVLRYSKAVKFKTSIPRTCKVSYPPRLNPPHTDSPAPFAPLITTVHASLTGETKSQYLFY